jgi:predicted ATPase
VTGQQLPLDAILGHYMSWRGFNQERLARESGVPVATIHRWTHGAVASPYHWEHMLRVAATLGLTRAQANRLLRAAAMPLLDQLETTLGAADDRRQLIERWRVVGRHNLPAALTSFVGRAEEVLDLAELLCERDTRLVTLTGPGGSGKTRLALRAAGELFDAFPDGVVFVDCAPLADPSLVLPSIAQTLGLRDVPRQSPLARLQGSLREQRVLLLLDNLEHLLDAGPGIVALLAGAPHVKVLATSRVPLHVSGEHERPVPPLALPQSGAALGDVSRAPAVGLFVARARAANPAFNLTRHNAADVADLCARLDGLPLAIELAAARVRELNPRELLERYPSRLDLSAGGPRDVPDRQRELRATIDWSHDLLAPDARRLLARLAVFAGGWTPEAAIAVCMDAGGSPDDVERDLQTLVDAGLIDRASGPSGVARYRMLETIREYALERLAASGDEADLRRRHARPFLALAESAEVYIPETRQGDWLDRVDAERDNLRAALAWSLAREIPLAARLAAALWPFWHEHSLLHEGRNWLDAALKRAGSAAPPAIRAQLLTGAAVLAVSQGDYPRAAPLVETALTSWRDLDDHHGQAITLRQRAWMAWSRGELAAALDDFQQAVAHWRALSEPRGVAYALSDAALLLVLSGRFAEAAPLQLEAFELFERHDDQLGLARSYADRGLAAMLQEDLSQAIPMLEQSVALCQTIGTSFILPGARFYLGTALCFAGHPDAALLQLTEALRQQAEMGDILGLSLTLLAFAAVAQRQGQAERAARLCGAVTSLHEQAGIVMVPVARAIYERELASVRAQLDVSTFNAAFAHGQTMTTPEVVAYALDA